MVKSTDTCFGNKRRIRSVIGKLEMIGIGVAANLSSGQKMEQQRRVLTKPVLQLSQRILLHNDFVSIWWKLENERELDCAIF